MLEVLIFATPIHLPCFQKPINLTLIQYSDKSGGGVVESDEESPHENLQRNFFSKKKL